jgi:hypothetical protein
VCLISNKMHSFCLLELIQWTYQSGIELTEVTKSDKN